MADNFFIEQKTFYWPTEYDDIMQMLQGKNLKGDNTHPGMTKTYAHAVIIAASLGLLHNRSIDVGKNKREIPMSAFENGRIGNTPLSSFLGLIFLLADEKNPEKNIDKLRETEAEKENNELYMIHVVENYAAGGLEYLRGSINEKGDETGEVVLTTEMLSLLNS